MHGYAYTSNIHPCYSDFKRYDLYNFYVNMVQKMYHWCWSGRKNNFLYHIFNMLAAVQIQNILKTSSGPTHFESFEFFINFAFVF